MYSTKQIAELMGISLRTVQNYVKGGVIKGTLVGGQWRFTESEVARLQAEGTQKGYYSEMMKGKKR